MIIREPEADEVGAMLALFAEEVAAGRMLPRDPAKVRAALTDWLVAVRGGEVLGCVSLVTFNPQLCEVRSLAVAPAARGEGLGTRLVEAALAMAAARDMPRVLVLTRAAALFEGLGFRRAPVGNFPAKVLQDCEPCPLKHVCDEVALVYHISGPPDETITEALPFYTALTEAGGEA